MFRHDHSQVRIYLILNTAYKSNISIAMLQCPTGIQYNSINVL